MDAQKLFGKRIKELRKQKNLTQEQLSEMLGVFQKLIENNATVVVIEHDLDVIANADYIIDMGPQGGKDGGEIVASGTIDDIINSKASITGRYLKQN